MGTTTTKLGLFKPDPDPVTGDDVDVDDINDNSDKIDAAAGFTICTSATRPSTPFDGQPIYETDTNLFYAWVEGAWTLTTPAASTTLAGKVELATSAEAITGTDTVRAITAAALRAVMETMFPVGSIYINYSVSTNPAVLFGFGTWTAMQDRVLIGAGGTYAAGSTGGAATKTLSTSEMPAHTHGLAPVSSNVMPTNQLNGISGYNANNAGVGSFATQSSGSGSSFSILPPYTAVYMWRRTV